MTTRTLLLLRHAKSSWKDSRLDDHDRPLNVRGRRAASRVGQLLRDEAFAIDLILCSTATRTQETATLVFAEMGETPSISYRDDLYHATSGEMTSILSQVVDDAKCVMVIGHNPGLEEFLAQLTGEALHFPTAALAQFELELDAWSQFNEQTRGHLAQLWRPKELGETSSEESKD